MVAVVSVARTERRWTETPLRDRVRGIEDLFYLVPRDLLAPFDELVNWLREREVGDGEESVSPVDSGNTGVSGSPHVPQPENRVNINRVTLTGNLTADPELKGEAGNVCRLRIATNTRRKDADGNWGDKPNYFDVVTFGNQAQNVERYLSKGSRIAIDGRLEWREWNTKEGEKRQSVEIVAESIEFLDRRDGRGSDPGSSDPAGGAAESSGSPE
jgi:single-strand DNA-binding protein